MRNRMIMTNSVFPGNHAATMRFPTAVVTAVIVILLMSLGAGVWGMNTLKASAQEDGITSQTGQVMTTQQQIDVKAEPDEKSETVFSYQAGDWIYVTGQTEDGWYIVYYQDKTGYINMAATEDVLTPVEIDVEEMDAQMAEDEAISRMIIEETMRYRAESRRSKIWGAVIVLLVVGIFAMGIISTVKANQKSGQEQNDGVQADKKSFRPKKSGSDLKEEDTDTGKAEQKEDEDILDLDKE